MPAPYKAPAIDAAAGASKQLTELPGRVLVCTMDVPWELFQKHHSWSPDHVYLVNDMDKETVEALPDTLPECDVVVGLGGGSACDSAKYVAWARGCRLIMAPTIVSVDAPLTNTVAVRVDKTVEYIGDIYPEEVIIDHDLIRSAPPEFNRAGACDIASIHTALHDWKLAHNDTGEHYDEGIAAEAKACLEELDRQANEVYNVTPKGIDTIIDLFRREVEFCARLGNSRPEEGSEHIVAYNLEYLTRRHFLHGDLVGFGIVAMARLQANDPDFALDLVQRCGLRYRVEDATEAELRETLSTLLEFKKRTGIFYSIVDTTPVDEAFIDETMNIVRG